MDVIFSTPINISLTGAQLVVEDSGKGTIQFQLFGQPVYLLVDAVNYVYDTPFAVGDRVKIIEICSNLGLGSLGIIQKIIPNQTVDMASVLFDTIYPDQIIKRNVITTVQTNDIKIEYIVPLKVIEKV